MEHASSLPKQLDESSRAALQGYVRQSMQQMLVALSPNIGVAAEHLLSEYQQLTSPAAAAEACTSTALGQTLGRRALASWTSSKLQLAFEHECLHLTCPVEVTTCPLCQHNPNRRCQFGNNFATKQLEKQPLLSCCGSSVRIGLTHYKDGWHGPAESCSSNSQATVQDRDGICLEFSLLNGSMHNHWLHQGDQDRLMDEHSRLACEVLRSRKAGKQALLQGGWMSQRTPEHRIRVKVTDKPTVLVDLTVQENSEAQLGKDVQYKLLVRALREDTDQELAQLVSQSFSVTTMRSKSGLKPPIPCLDDPVTKLEGVGEKTRRNLLDVPACAASLTFPAALPQDCPAIVTTVRGYKDLVECLEVRNHCPKLLTRALLPEAATGHAMRAVSTDNRGRRWKPHPESDWELLYSCSQGQIDWSSPDVLRCGTGDRGWQATARQASQQEAAKRAELADAAITAWKQEGHPGWSLDSVNSHCMQHWDQQQNRGLLQYGDTDMIKPLQQSESMVGPCPGWRLGSEGSSGRPHCKGASPAPLSALSAFPSRSDTTTSSGSLSSAPHRHPRRTCDRTAGINTPQRSSKRLALKQAQRDTQGSPASSLTQLHPETELRLEEVLGQPLPGRGGPALPYRLRGQLGDDLGVRQLSQEGSLLPGLSNCKGPAPCETQAAYSVLTLDQALDSINPTASLPMGLQNPFEAVAGDSSWQTPSRAEGTEGRDGRASPCSTVTCLQDQLAFRLPLQGYSPAGFASLPLPNPISFEDDPGFGLELGPRPCTSLEPAAKRGKWAAPEQQTLSDELEPVTCPPHTAAEQSKSSLGRSSMSKSGRWCHSAKQSSTHSAGASADTVGPSEGIFNQPCGQACNPDPRLSGLLQPVRAFLKAHMAKRSEPWGSADLRCSVTDPQGMAEEIRQQQQQSFKHLLERQKL